MKLSSPCLSLSSCDVFLSNPSSMESCFCSISAPMLVTTNSVHRAPPIAIVPYFVFHLCSRNEFYWVCLCLLYPLCMLNTQKKVCWSSLGLSYSNYHDQSLSSRAPLFLLVCRPSLLLQRMHNWVRRHPLVMHMHFEHVYGFV